MLWAYRWERLAGGSAAVRLEAAATEVVRVEETAAAVVRSAAVAAVRMEVGLVLGMDSGRMAVMVARLAAGMSARARGRRKQCLARRQSGS